MLCMIANGCHLKLNLYAGLNPCKRDSPQAIYSLGTFHVLSAVPPPRIFEQGGSNFFSKEAEKIWTDRTNFSKVPTKSEPFRFHISKGADKN